MPPLVGELEEQCAARRVVGLLGRASAVVGVAVIKLSEEHGSHSWRCGRRTEPLPSTIALAGGSQDAAVPFDGCGLIFVYFGLDSEQFRPALPRRAHPAPWRADIIAARSRLAVAQRDPARFFRTAGWRRPGR